MRSTFLSLGLSPAPPTASAYEGEGKRKTMNMKSGAREISDFFLTCTAECDEFTQPGQPNPTRMRDERLSLDKPRIRQEPEHLLPHFSSLPTFPSSRKLHSCKKFFKYHRPHSEGRGPLPFLHTWPQLLSNLISLDCR